MPRGARTTMSAVVAMVVLAAACGGSSGGSASGAPAKLSVELDWVPNPDHVGLFFAQDQGLYAEHGLAVDFRAPSNAADPIKLVGLGDVDVAISYEPELFYALQNGLAVRAVATVVPVPLNSLIVQPDEHVTQLSDLAGTSVGVTGIPTDDAFFQTMLKTAGLNASDVTKVNVGFNLVTSLLSHKVDSILGGFRNVEAIQVKEETGVAPTVFTAGQLGVPPYAELVVVANQDRLSGDSVYADAVQRFIAALIEGTNGAIADPAKAIQVMKRATQYQPAFLDASVPATLRLLTPAPGTKTGCIDAAAWQRFGEWMYASGLIASSPDASAISTDAYMPYGCR
jgi:putative hydroxymethylpyrimidine transport system substrate-binding protein